MTSRNIKVAAGVLLCALSAPVASQGSKDWVDINDPKELRALHTNKTFRSTFSGEAVVEHYCADGKGLYIHAKAQVPQTWEIKGTDQVCVTGPDGTSCKRF